MKPLIIAIICVSTLSSGVFSYRQSERNEIIRDSSSTRFKRDESKRPLWELVTEGSRNIDEITEFVGDVDAERDESGNTALILAAKNGNNEIVDLPIQKGANINATSKYDHTALIRAAWHGHKETVDLLIQRGANIEAPEQYRYTALMMAVEAGHKEIVDFLIQKGANIEAVNDFGETALMRAAQYGYNEIVNLLIQKGANINAVSRDRHTALIFAGERVHEEVMRSLIENGANLRLRDSYEKTAKDMAVERGAQLLRNINIHSLFGVSNRACTVYSKYIEEAEKRDEDAIFRVIGGESARAGEFPWMAALGYVSLRNLRISFDCGGTLISDSFVLTAAHCVTNRRPPTLVRFGINPHNNAEYSGHSHHIQNIIKHPEYSLRRKTNDIALVQLKDRLYFSDSIKPACLYTDTRDVDLNVDLTVTGWGLISVESRKRSDTLHKANLKTMPLRQCNTTLFESNQGINMPSLRNGLIEGQYCAYDPNGVQDSCEGDSGGPLQIIGNDTVATRIVAIVSFSCTGTCGTRLPSIYTRVAIYIDWIESIVWPNDEVIPPLVNEAW